MSSGWPRRRSAASGLDADRRGCRSGRSRRVVDDQQGVVAQQLLVVRRRARPPRIRRSTESIRSQVPGDALVRARRSSGPSRARPPAAQPQPRVQREARPGAGCARPPDRPATPAIASARQARPCVERPGQQCLAHLLALRAGTTASSDSAQVPSRREESTAPTGPAVSSSISQQPPGSVPGQVAGPAAVPGRLATRLVVAGPDGRPRAPRAAVAISRTPRRPRRRRVPARSPFHDAPRHSGRRTRPPRPYTNRPFRAQRADPGCEEPCAGPLRQRQHPVQRHPGPVRGRRRPPRSG